MNIVCFDMESVLTPEIWIEFSRVSGSPELCRNTRYEPDYDKLMKWRLAILKEHGLGIREVQDVISRIDPLPGAKDFLDRLREKVQVVILSDTFEEFAGPLMKKLGMPMMPRDLNISVEDTMDAFTGAREVRDKYLSCSFLWDMGLTEEGREKVGEIVR